MAEDEVLLEFLAATGWFTAHGEVALTGGLTFCLQKDPAAARGLVQLLRVCSGHTEQDLPSPDRWQAEFVTDTRGRPDITGWVGTGDEAAPIVVVEAKLSAAFGAQQVSDYVERFQRPRLESARQPYGALAVLVPEARLRLAQEEVTRNLARLGARPGPHDKALVIGGATTITATVISWEEVLTEMAKDASSAGGDLQQLRGACRALQGLDVPALGPVELAGGWHLDDLHQIIDRVTRMATTEVSLRLAPWQPKSSDGLAGGFRYLAPPPVSPSMAVGVRLDAASPPLWVRWHKLTADLRLVESRLIEVGVPVQRSGGHVWVPLDIEPDTGSALRQIDRLVQQVVQLYKIATGGD